MDFFNKLTVCGSGASSDVSETIGCTFCKEDDFTRKERAMEFRRGRVLRGGIMGVAQSGQ